MGYQVNPNKNIIKYFLRSFGSFLKVDLVPHRIYKNLPKWLDETN